MIVDKKLLNVWQKELAGKNLTKVAKDAGINYRTLLSTLETGKTISKVQDKLNAYILRERVKLKKVLNED